MVGDDEVEAEAASGFRFSKGAHAGVNGDDKTDTFSMGSFKHARLHAVAIAQAVRDVEADEIPWAAEHFDCGFEQNHGDCSVDVVVAVEQDRFTRGDGALDAIDGAIHAEHQIWIVEMGGFGIEESEGLSSRGNAAPQQKLGEGLGNSCLAGEGSGLVRMLVG